MEYLLFLGVVFLGALTVLKLRLDDPRFVRLFNAFTGAYLLCLSFLHLVPSLYGEGHAHGVAGAEPLLPVGVFVLIGFFAQVLLESLTMGAEHGHTHGVHDHACAEEHPVRAGGGVVQWGVVVGLCIHALVEATALGDKGHHHDPASRSLLLWGIVVHKYPVTVAFLGSLLQTGISRGRALGLLGVFALMAPVGLWLGAHSLLAEHSRELTALVVGIFMHVATTVLFETTESHAFNRGKLVAIVCGLTAGLLTLAVH